MDSNADDDTPDDANVVFQSEVQARIPGFKQMIRRLRTVCRENPNDTEIFLDDQDFSMMQEYERLIAEKCKKCEVVKSTFRGRSIRRQTLSLEK